MDDLTEEQARQMEAGRELDHCCALFMGYTEDCEYHDMGPECPPMPEEFYRNPDGEPYDHTPPPFSTDWSAAGPLLEVMMQGDNDKRSQVYLLPRGKIGVRQPDAHAVHSLTHKVGETISPLAIARACAVLVARGVTREEVEGE